MKKRGLRKTLNKYILRHEYITILIIFACLALLFGFLSKIPTNASVAEYITGAESKSLISIYENPVNAPYKITTYLLTSISPSVRMIRAVSFIFFIATTVSIFYVLKHWHTIRASLLTTIAFATNAVVLGTARLGTPLITAMSFYMFSAFLLWQLHTRSNKAVPIIVLVALSALIYTPGVIWFLLILLTVYWKSFAKLYKNVKRQAILTGALLSLIVMFPLLLSFVQDASVLKEWLLLPQVFDWNNIPRSILRVPSAFIYRMPIEPLINVGRLPVFDLASGILFLIGLNAYRQKLSLDRTRVMIGSAIIGIIIGALGQLLIAVILLIPFAFSVIAAGIEFLLDQWNGVFPRNPYARSFGFLMVTIVVLFGSYYQLIRFLVVWPQTPPTRETYNQSRIINESLQTDTINSINAGDSES